MGMSRLGSIQAGLRVAGLPAEMPAAVIERAASPDERVLVTSLGLLAREAQLGGYASPAVIVVGEVVALATVREAELRRCWRAAPDGDAALQYAKTIICEWVNPFLLNCNNLVHDLRQTSIQGDLIFCLSGF